MLGPVHREDQKSCLSAEHRNRSTTNGITHRFGSSAASQVQVDIAVREPPMKLDQYTVGPLDSSLYRLLSMNCSPSGKSVTRLVSSLEKKRPRAADVVAVYQKVEVAPCGGSGSVG